MEMDQVSFFFVCLIFGLIFAFFILCLVFSG